MSLQTVHPFIWAPPRLRFAASLGSPRTTTLDSNTEWLFFPFVAPRTETLDRFEFCVQSVGAGGNAEVQICTVAADGAPDATVGSEPTVNVTGFGNYQVTGLGAAVTQGTRYGVRVMVASGVNIGVQNSWGGGVGDSKTTEMATNVTGSTVRSTVSYYGIPIGLGTSAGYLSGYSPYWAGAGVMAISSANINSAATDFEGNKIIFPFAGRLHGLAFPLQASIAPYDLTAIAANAAGTILASRVLDDGIDWSNNGNAPVEMYFGTPYDFAAAETVYCLVRNETANNVLIYNQTFRSADSIAALWGAGCCRVNGSTLGTYAEDTDAICLVYPIISALDDGVGGGGGLAANPIKGFLA